jgi:8-oxo-dGTP pyrophosphatase MutT (NUDIX family)
MKEKTIAAGMFVLCYKTGRHLLLKRRCDVKYAGYWGSPGGSFDDVDENPKVTALREFKEETGYCGKMHISKEPLLVERSNHIDFYTYLCVVPEEFIPNLKGEMVIGQEHDNYAWFKLDILSKKIMPTTIEILNNKKDVLNKVIKNFNNG